MCSTSNEDDLDLDSQADCSRCGVSMKLDWKNTQCVLEHMGAHILHDITLSASEEHCGLCLQPALMCQIYLMKGRHSMDWLKSRCPNLVCFNYRNTSESSKWSPCSNVPIDCSICPPVSPAVWTYSFHSHYWECHWIVSALNFLTCVELSQSEKNGIKQVWDSHVKQQGSYHKWHKCVDNPPLVISEAHCLGLPVG